MLIWWFICASTLLIFGYIFVLLWSLISWQKREHFTLNKDAQPSVSIIIAARNEAKGIEECLSSISLSCEDYFVTGEKYEIILVDDQSTDDTVAIATNSAIPNLKIITANKSGKKSAIEDAVAYSTGQILIFTDGDTIVSEKWIEAHINYHNRFDFVTGLISFVEEDSIVSRLQTDDMVATMLLTHAGIKDKCYYMANGANMSIKKTLWSEMQESRTDDDISSGDDVFLIQKIANDHFEKIGFLSDLRGKVTTSACATWSDFIAQRKRWAGKTRYTHKNWLTGIQAMVFAIVLTSWMLIFAGAFTLNYKLLTFGFCLNALKQVIDYLYLKKGRSLLDYNVKAPYFLNSSLLYQYYILLMGIVVIFPSNVKWKGREVNH